MATVKFKDSVLTLLGNEVKVGQPAPDFKVQKSADMSDYTLASGAGKTRIIATVPSLDTPVCDLEAKRFNEEASKLNNVEMVVVSMDLPFAQKRFCGTEGIENVTTVSAFRDSFGSDYGVTITDGPMAGLLGRAVVVIGADGNVAYAELVPEIANEPNYDAALAALSA